MKDLHQAVTAAWEGDDQLLKNAHTEHESMAACIQVNVDTIRQAAFTGEIRCWNIHLQADGDPLVIGYMVRMRSNGMTFLYSFGIKKDYRSRDIKRAWLAEVNRVMYDEKFFVPLFRQNVRAINFFERNGFLNRHDVDDKLALLWQ